MVPRRKLHKRANMRRQGYPAYNPKSPEYEAYLHSPQWREMRDRIIRERQGRCEGCGLAHRELHLHHKTYVRLYDEVDSDMILLCPDCHDGMHGRWGSIAKRARDKAVKEAALRLALVRCPSGPPVTAADRWLAKCKASRQK